MRHVRKLVPKRMPKESATKDESVTGCTSSFEAQEWDSEGSRVVDLKGFVWVDTKEHIEDNVAPGATDSHGLDD